MALAAMARHLHQGDAQLFKDAPGRIEAGITGLEAMGGKMISFLVVMGEYDYAAIAEGPSDEVVTTFCLALSSLGNVKTTTIKGFTPAEFAAMVKNLP